MVFDNVIRKRDVRQIKKGKIIWRCSSGSKLHLPSSGRDLVEGWRCRPKCVSVPFTCRLPTIWILVGSVVIPERIKFNDAYILVSQKSVWALLKGDGEFVALIER